MIIEFLNMPITIRQHAVIGIHTAGKCSTQYAHKNRNCFHWITITGPLWTCAIFAGREIFTLVINDLSHVPTTLFGYDYIHVSATTTGIVNLQGPTILFLSPAWSGSRNVFLSPACPKNIVKKSPCRIRSKNCITNKCSNTKPKIVQKRVQALSLKSPDQP